MAKKHKSSESHLDDFRRQLDPMVKKYGSEAGCTPEAAIADLLADIMHLCDERGISFSAALRRAVVVHDEEVESAVDTPRVKAINSDLSNQRRAAAEAAFAGHDFGSDTVKDTGVWESNGLNSLVRTIYLEGHDEKPSIKVLFRVNFSPDTAAVLSFDIID